MASPKPFIFSDALFVPPTVCTVCGNNTRCIRRQHQRDGEIQTFLCACGNEEVRVRTPEPTDAEILEAAERRVAGGSI